MYALFFALLACETQPLDHAGEPGALGPTSRAADLEVRAVRIDGADSSRIELARGDEVAILVDRGNPDRAVLSPDGAHVAYVSGLTGLASVWVVEARAGAEPRQLTNVGLEGVPREPGRPPPGFVPPPHDHSLAFVGDALAWDSPSGPQRVVWR